MAKLYFYFSAMNAGKSTTLLQSDYNYRERGMDTLLLMPKIDDRHTKGHIHSRIGLSAHAYSFSQDENLFEIAKHELEEADHLACVLVDEAQFLLRDQVHQLTEVADKLHVPVLAYGLRTDYKGEPFEGSRYLLAWAESLVEIKTVCYCGKKATMNLRIDAKGHPVREGDQIFIGGNESYVATCRTHFKSGGYEG